MRTHGLVALPSSPFARTVGTTLLVVLFLFGSAPPSLADTIYTPSPNNGQKVYLSQACHNQNGTPPCVENTGCDGYRENRGSGTMIWHFLTNSNGVGGLWERQYIVRHGNGTTQQNISNSNAWGARMHIPVHSNATPWNCSSPWQHGTFGTIVFHVSTNGSQLANEMKNKVGPSSPGTNDKSVRRTNLGELNQTTAVAAYLEAEFHTFGLGVNWLRTPSSWGWRLGYAIDSCRGYPRSGQPLSTKTCTW